jgi:hypothetical protein
MNDNMAAMDPRTFAEQFFNAQDFAAVQEDRLYDRVLKIFGVDHEDTDNWPFHDLGWDSYDNSIEMKCDVTTPWAPTEEQMQKLFTELGFSQCWVCYGERNNDLGYNELYFAKKKI